MHTIHKEWTDYNGNVRKEDFLFHLTKADILKLEFSKKGGLTAYCNRIIAAQNIPELAELFSELLDLSYGVKTDDGRGFMKRPDLLLEFKETEAYSQIYMDLALDSKKAGAFINAVAPADLREEAHKIAQENPGLAVLEGGKTDGTTTPITNE